MTELATLDRTTPALPATASRRTWLKGLGALLGTGLLAAPTAAFARPAAGSPLPGTAPAPATATPAAASDLVGGDEFIGLVMLLTGTSVPAGWLPCDGRELPIAGHRALFTMLGTTYGGDGRHTFALPDMRADMANLAAAVARQPAGAAPLGQLCAVKVANAPALTTAVTELRLLHLRQTRPVAA